MTLHILLRQGYLYYSKALQTDYEYSLLPDSYHQLFVIHIHKGF